MNLCLAISAASTAVFIARPLASGKVADMYEKGVVEPLSVKEQAIKSATESASMILRIDDVIAVSKPKEEEAGGPEKGEDGSEF